jgi:F-type H+-transporting ATPase subunit a
VSGGERVLAVEGWPPSVKDFYLPGWAYPWITKFTVLVWLAVAVIISCALMAATLRLRPGRN